MADYIGKDGSLNFDPHMQLRCDPDFMIMFDIEDILYNPEVVKEMGGWASKSLKDAADKMGFNLDSVELSREFHPNTKKQIIIDQAVKKLKCEERRWNTERGIDNVTRFDVIANENWKHLMPPGTVPEMMIQHRARKRALMDMRVPSLTQDFFYREYDTFKDVCNSSLDELNDTTGDILSGEYIQYRFEPVAVMTDYCGTINGEENSFTTDTNYLNTILSKDATIDNVLKQSVVDGNRLVNFISVVFRNSILKFQNYPQLSLREPYESDVSYIRHTFLFKGVS